jgi:hypothetical protein
MDKWERAKTISSCFFLMVDRGRKSPHLVLLLAQKRDP